MAWKVAIGFTSYVDLSTREVGGAIFNALASTSEKLVPEIVEVWNEKAKVETASDFAEKWFTETPFEVREGRSRKAPLIRKGVYRIGANWRRKHALKGIGSLTPRAEDNYQGDDCIVIEYDFSKRIDWASLFSKLVAITQPAHAMLHVFEGHSDKVVRGQDQLDFFDGPIAGESWFTSWKTSTGHWQRPEPWKVADRKRYRFLPDLAWLNHFGPEFDSQFNPQELTGAVAAVEPEARGLSVRLSDDVSDVFMKPAQFEEIRSKARRCFAPEFFRSPLPDR
jgi:hypothetical protein